MHGMEHIKPLNILQILFYYIPEYRFFLTCSLGGSQSLNLHLLYLCESLYICGFVSLSTGLLSPERNKSRYPLDKCPIPGLDVLEKKSLLRPPGFEPWVVQPATYSLYWLRLLYVDSILQRRSSERCIIACVSFLHNILLKRNYALWLRVQSRSWVTAGCWFSQLWQLPYCRKIDH